ncbi:MAG: hypothetical protein WC683_04225 [bacterium]
MASKKTPKTYKGVFEVFDVRHRRFRDTKKLTITLEAPYDKAEEKKLLDLLFLDAEVTIVEHEEDPELPNATKDAKEALDSQDPA